MAHFSMFVQTKANVKLTDGNMGHNQIIGIILCHFSYCPIIHPTGPVYYYPFNPYNTISSGALKFYIGI